jgi:hypothetical protein
MLDVGDITIGAHWIDRYVRRWWNGNGVRNNCNRGNSGHRDNVRHHVDIGQHSNGGNVGRSRHAANLWDVDNLRNWNGRSVRALRI